MKKVIISFIILCIFLNGCKKIDINSNPNDNNMLKELNIEDVKVEHNNANKILQMLMGSGLEADCSDAYSNEGDFYNYCAVTYNGINSIEELKNYLNGIFSANITDELMNIGVVGIFDKYIEKDNKLYQVNYDYSMNLNGCDIKESDIDVKKISDTKYICYTEKSVSGNFDIGESSEKIYKFEYIYEYVNGAWIFTEFPILKPYMDLDYQYSQYTRNYDIVAEVKDDSVIETSFDIAKEIYAWFAVSDDITDRYYKEVLIGDHIYYKVYNQKIKNMSDLQNYMKTVFSDEVVDSFIRTNTFIEIDKELYVVQHAFPIRGFGISETNVEKINDNKYIYHVKLSKLSDDGVTYTSEYIMKEYPYEYVDGRWVFTDFPSPLR